MVLEKQPRKTALAAVLVTLLLFCSDHLSLAEVLQWPQQLLALWPACELGIPAGFPMPDSQHWYFAEEVRHPSTAVSSCLQMCHVNEVWENRKEAETQAELSPAGLAAPHSCSVFTFTVILYLFHFVLLHPHAISHMWWLVIRSQYWRGCPFPAFSFYNFWIYSSLCWEKQLHESEYWSPNLYTFPRTTEEKFIFQNGTFLLFGEQKDNSEDTTRCLQ